MLDIANDITINGKAEVVVQDAEAYQELLERVETIEGIQRGLADVKAGRTKPAREVLNRLRRKHGHTALSRTIWLHRGCSR